jgi:CO/xanthine dehydrogenase Mo-binding subunit
VAAHDVGKAINPAFVEGQISGGIASGLGQALTENITIDKGRTINPSFTDYLIPTSVDMPEVQTIIVEENEPSGPFGAKCVGEPPSLPTAPAIINAIYNAVGVRIKDLPATPEKILQALKEKRGKP